MSGQRENRMAAPDVLRVAAIFIVGWFHIWQQSWLDPSFRIGEHYVNIQQIVRHGSMMVDIMLLLSGFLLALPVARQRQQSEVLTDPGRFFQKRFWRIAPCYYLCVMLTTVFYALPQHLYSSTGFMIKDLLMHATFTHVLSYQTYFFSPTAATIWTLSVEVQFYVIWPLLARLYIKRPGETCLGLMVIALVFRSWVSSRAYVFDMFNQLPGQLDLYAWGMAAAMLYTRAEQDEVFSLKTRRWLAPVGMLLAFAAMLCAMYAQPLGEVELFMRGQMLWRFPMGIFGAVFLVCGCLAPPGLAKALGNPLTRFLSDISYNFYLWHQFLACRLKDWHFPPSVAEMPNQAYEQPWQTQYTLVCFLGVAAFSALLTYLIEKPVRRWGLRHLRSRKEPSAL